MAKDSAQSIEFNIENSPMSAIAFSSIEQSSSALFQCASFFSLSLSFSMNFWQPMRHMCEYALFLLLQKNFKPLVKSNPEMDKMASIQRTIERSLVTKRKFKWLPWIVPISHKMLVPRGCVCFKYCYSICYWGRQFDANTCLCNRIHFGALEFFSIFFVFCSTCQIVCLSIRNGIVLFSEESTLYFSWLHMATFLIIEKLLAIFFSCHCCRLLNIGRVTEKYR